jgi:hypothetical protein
LLLLLLSCSSKRGCDTGRWLLLLLTWHLRHRKQCVAKTLLHELLGLFGSSTSPC